MEVPVIYSLFNGTAPLPLQVAGPLEDLMIPVVERPGGKRRQASWSPALFSPPYRLNEHVISLSAVVLDLDICPGYPELISGINTLPYEAWVYPTWKHQKTGACRAVVPFSAPLPISTWGALYNAVLDDFRAFGAQGDPSCSDPARLYLRPILDRGPNPSYNNQKLAVNLHYTEVHPIEHSPTSTTAHTTQPAQLQANPSTIIHFDSGELRDGRECQKLSPGKYKCACPYVDDAATGSAFLRVTDKRGVLVCTSQRHGHPDPRWVLWGSTRGRPPADGGGMSQPNWTPDGSPPIPQEPGEGGEAEEKRKYPELPDDIREDVVYHRGIQKFICWNPARRGWNLEAPLGMEAMKMWLASRTSGYAIGDLTMLTIAAARSAVEDTTFVPDGPRVVGEALNLWCAPDPLPPAAPDFHRIRQIIRVICGGDQLAIKWFLHWMAALVQQPEKVGMTAVVVKSHRQGIGKSLLGEILERILGPNNCAVVSNSTLADTFNSSYVSKVFVRGEEISYSGDPGVIKLYITGNRIPFRVPHANRAEIPNRMTWYFTSNNVVPISLEADDRRFTVFEPIDIPRGHKEALSEMFDNHGKMTPGALAEVAAFADYLHAVNVDWKAISVAYATEAKVKIQAVTTDSTSRFISDMEEDATFLRDDCMGMGTGHMTAPHVGATWLYRCYQRWCTEHGERWVPEGTFRLQVCIYDNGRIQYGRGRVAGRMCSIYAGFEFPRPLDGERAIH